LGIYTEKYNLLDLNYIVYSNDPGYDPLIKHLSENNIRIRREDKNIPIKIKQTILPKIETKNEEIIIIGNNVKNNDVEKHYEKLIKSIKKTESVKRPKTKKGLEEHIKTLMSKKITDKDSLKNMVMDLVKLKKDINIENNNTHRTVYVSPLRSSRFHLVIPPKAIFRLSRIPAVPAV
jgi:hypothetical protein